MSGSRPFTRQLGYQPGVQLNPLRDNTDGAVPDNSDQVFAVVARLTRGRIDRPFLVDRGNFLAKTGAPESVRVSALNEAKLQTYEALMNGAYRAVVQRLTPAAAAKSYAVINFSGSPVGSSTTTAFSASASAPTTDWSVAVLDHECHNAGIKVAIHADSTPLGGTPVANAELTLRIMDAAGVLRYEVAGSLDPTAKDEFGRSKYLPDVASRLFGDAFEVLVATSQTVPTTSDAYGRDTAGKDKWATSGVLACFNEAGTTYASTDYDRCIAALRDAQDSFGYIISGGTQVTSLLGKLRDLAVEINAPLKYDIGGSLSVSGAIAMANTLGFDTHLVQGFWAPLEADDPLNGGRTVWGAAGLNAGFACARNAQVNADGFAPKNFPVAGKAYPLNRTAVRQLVRPTEQDLSDLAKARINPVIFTNYNGGGRYVFTDCLTGANSLVSYKKLATVAEMSVSLDGWVTLYANELLQLPMVEFVRRMRAFMQELLEGAVAAQWLVPSQNLEGNAPFKFTVGPSQARPADLALIDYWTSYDGVARQVIVQQTLTK